VSSDGLGFHLPDVGLSHLPRCGLESLLRAGLSTDVELISEFRGRGWARHLLTITDTVHDSKLMLILDQGS
jgi:hypothetical protein